MSSNFRSAGFGEGENDVLVAGYDEMSGASITLFSCPEEAIGCDGPVFEHFDKKTIYVLISEDYVEQVKESAPNLVSAAVQYGMLLGDVMRRGVYYAQSINNKKNKSTRRNSNEQQ